MASLAHFPSEILATITSSLNGFDIARLWLAGERMLMARLETGGVVRFDLALAQTVSCRWPAIISRFTRLQSLSIRPKSALHRLWFRDVDLAGISSSLNHLELEFDNLEGSLMNVPFVISDRYPDPIWSPPTGGQMAASRFSLKTCFPSLKTVSFGGELQNSLVLIPMLPIGLVSLSLAVDHLNTSLVRQLPPNLTRLELPKCSKMEISEKVGLTFPSSVTHLDVRQLELFKCADSTCLPPNLTHLNARLATFPDFDFSKFQLPPTLVSLVDLSSTALSKEFYEKLPPRLLHLRAEHQTLLISPENLPSGLQTLELRHIKDLSPNTIVQLPSSLSHLALRATALSAESILCLSAHLRSLTIGSSLRELETPYPFMSTLEHLVATNLDPSVLAYAPKLRSLEISGFFYKLVPKLNHLTSLTSISFGVGLNIDAETFPASLTHLKVLLLDSPDDFLHLPRGLKSLIISVRCDISEASIAHLPRGLTELQLPSLDFCESISDASIELLPKYLESFTLDYASDITDNGIAKLPRTLRYCMLGNASLLTDASAALFPRQLTSLEVGAPKLSNACAKHLPRTLTTFNQTFLASKLTIDCIPDLPPKLSAATCGIWK